MILRRAAIAYFAIAALCSSVYGAELTLESREIPSPQVTGQRALRLIEIFEQLAVGPPQHMAIADLLRPIPGLREAAETAEADALKTVGEALAQKLELMLKEEPVPEELETTIEDAFLKAAQARAEVGRAEQAALDSIFSRLTDYQQLAIQWEFGGGPSDADRQALIESTRRQMMGMQGLVDQLLAPQLEAIWSIRNTQQYRRQRAAVAQQILEGLVGQRMLMGGPGMADQYMSNLFQYFDHIRAMPPEQFQMGLRSGMISQTLLRSLGVGFGGDMAQMPRVPEQELRDLLLDPYCITMITTRADTMMRLVQDRRRGE